MVLNSLSLSVPLKGVSVPKPSREIASCILEESPKPWIHNILCPIMLSQAKMQNECECVKVQSEEKIGWSLEGRPCSWKLSDMMMLFIKSYLCKTEEVMDNKSTAKALLCLQGYWVFHWSCNGRSETESLSVQVNAPPYLCAMCRVCVYFWALLWVYSIYQEPCALLLHVFVCMFALRKTEGWQGLQGRPEIFDLNTYFHILVMSEKAPVKRDKACVPACLQVIHTVNTGRSETGMEMAYCGL